MTNITYNCQNDEMTISIEGIFNYELAMEFSLAYKSESVGTYIIDLATTQHLDSTALGILINMKKTIDAKAIIKVINASKEIKRLLNISRLDTYVKII